MYSAKHAVIFWTASTTIAIIHTWISTFALYNKYFDIILPIFTAITGFCLGLGPGYLFNTPFSPKQLYCYYTALFSYLLAAGTFVTSLSHLLYGDRSTQDLHWLRIVFLHTAFDFTVIGTLEPVRENRWTIQPCFFVHHRLFSYRDTPVDRIDVTTACQGSASFYYALYLSLDALLHQVYGPDIGFPSVFDVFNSKIDRFIVVPFIILNVTDTYDTINHVIGHNAMRMLRLDPMGFGYPVEDDDPWSRIELSRRLWGWLFGGMGLQAICMAFMIAGLMKGLWV